MSPEAFTSQNEGNRDGVLGLEIQPEQGLLIVFGNGKSPFLIGNTSSKGPFFTAMLVYRRISNMITIYWAVPPPSNSNHRENFMGVMGFQQKNLQLKAS